MINQDLSNVLYILLIRPLPYGVPLVPMAGHYSPSESGLCPSRGVDYAYPLNPHARAVICARVHVEGFWCTLLLTTDYGSRSQIHEVWNQNQ